MKLLFIHGRSQEDKHPAVLRHKWVSSLHRGADAIGREIPLSDDDIIFPYFGDALVDLTAEDHPEHHHHDGEVAPIAKASTREDDFEFRCRVLNDCLDGAGIIQELILKDPPPPVRASGPLSNEWVHLGLSLLDRFIPSVSSRSLNASAADVVLYLNDSKIAEHVNAGIAESIADIDPTEPLVVVGHSLGSIIAYRLLSTEGYIDRPVETFITLGSPLAITAVRNALAPIHHPKNVGRWFNAYDQRDIIALNPLDEKHFDVYPAIENYGGVENPTPNHHGISGYLSDPFVAERLVTALSGLSGPTAPQFVKSSSTALPMP